MSQPKPPPPEERKRQILEGEALGPWPNSPQEQALESDADIVIYGGAAGGGKSYGLLLAALRGIHDPEHRGVLFRRTFSQLDEEGALIDEANGLFGRFGEYNKQEKRWTFESGARISFSHLEHEKHIQDWDGAQLSFAGFDQLEQFTRKMFFHLYGRLRRPAAKIEPQLWATCNPTDSSHWLYKLIQWWLTDEGYPDEDRAGKKRWFFRDGDDFKWVDKEARDADGMPPTSIAFIPAKVEDNPYITEKDPKYIQRLNAYGYVEREQKRRGRWGVSQAEGMFKNHDIRIVDPDEVPDGIALVRDWDLADTDDGGDATASVKLGITHEVRWCCQQSGDEKGEGECLNESKEPVDFCPVCGCEHIEKETKQVVWILDATEWWVSGAAKRQKIKRVVWSDTTSVSQGLEQGGGGGGKENAERYADTIFKGYDFHIHPSSAGKEERMDPLVPIAEQGRMMMARAPWNDRLISVLEDFPHKDKDLGDALSGAYHLAASGKVRGAKKVSWVL